ncbi:DUF3147 family protein [Bacillus aquiflavi]|uniref:DUF3147 family protein n=1 Tax=Bacillus aquiflavi TaxID=2672567 RepID=A0A6B3VSY1_9BACI|nr:DUF3147 family protein [Bacillus aquiflavi]MBA4535953.1 DUF3147 family protein [Bacillus aquiflavi]NEY80328.1 DUF3147 family protein [Bacillus aquiflavi]UAC49807.1 DUF3147 family protein [Bacillus aquiflavi]
MYMIGKIIVSSIIIGIVTEIARRFPTYGGIVAALPLVSLLSIIWLHVQGEQTTTLSKFILGVLLGFPASAVLLLITYISLKNSIHLVISICFGIGGWFAFLLIQEVMLKYVAEKM